MPDHCYRFYFAISLFREDDMTLEVSKQSRASLSLVLLGCWLGGVFDGMDSTLMSVVNPSAIPELIGSHDKVLITQHTSYIIAIFLAGWTLGGIIFGMIGDALGRVRSMVMSILLYALFTGLAGFAQSWEMLAVCRFLTGIGIGGELVSITTYLAEVWPEKTRSLAIGLLVGSYQAGVFLAGLVDKLVDSMFGGFAESLQMSKWRLVFFVGTLPALLAVALRLLMPESEKWKNAQVHAVDAKKDFSQLKELLGPANRRSALMGGLIFCGLLIGYWASLAWIPTWIQSLFPQGSPDATSARATATMIQGVLAFFGCVSSGFLCDRVGRRWAMVIGFTGCLLGSALLFLTNDHFSSAIFWESGFLGYFIGLAQANVYIYLPELFPTRIRATGIGFGLNSGRTMTILAVLLAPLLVATLGGYANAAFALACSYVIGIVAALMSRETKGLGLPK